MIEFWLPMIASVLQGGVGMALNAGQATRINNQNIRLAQIRREDLQPLIDELRGARDFFQSEEQLVRDFSRASNQMAAQSAQSGMTNAGSGGLDQQRSDLLGAMIAQLSQVKMQDEAQRRQLLAELLSDPTLYEGERPMGNVGLDAFLGGIGGAIGGAGTQLASYLSTPEGIDILKSLGAANRQQKDKAPPGLWNYIQQRGLASGGALNAPAPGGSTGLVGGTGRNARDVGTYSQNFGYRPVYSSPGMLGQFTP